MKKIVNRAKENYREIKKEIEENHQQVPASSEEEETSGPVKVFYPVINYDGCIKCMVCVKLCPNQVFEIKNGLPVVTNPMACDSDCQICGVKCPTRVISFVSKIKWG